MAEKIERQQANKIKRFYKKRVDSLKKGFFYKCLLRETFH